MPFFGCQSGADRLLGLVPPAAQVQQLGTASEQVGIASCLFQRVLDDGQGLVILADALERPTQPDRGSTLVLGIFENALIECAGFLIIAVQPALARVAERLR